MRKLMAENEVWPYFESESQTFPRKNMIVYMECRQSLTEN